MTLKSSKGQFIYKIAISLTEVHFASFLSGGFTTVAVINQPERKLTKRTSVQYGAVTTIAYKKLTENVLMLGTQSFCILACVYFISSFTYHFSANNCCNTTLVLM